jgi:dipeptidyl aminopeptidase/acylaminoacyl peptidase
MAVPAALAAEAASAPSAHVTPLRDFFRNADKAGYAISPGGGYLAYLAPVDHRMNVFVQPIAGGEAKAITTETARDIAGFFWKSDDRIVYVKDFGGDENFHVVSVDRKGGNLRDLTPFPKVRAEIFDELEDDATDILVGLNQRNPEIFDVYRLNTANGQLKMVAQNPGKVTSWLTDHKGAVRVAVESDGVNQTLLYRATEKDTFKSILTTSFKESVHPLFFTFDNKRLYVESNRGRDLGAFFEFDPATAKEGKLVYEHPTMDVSELAYSRKRKVLTYAETETWKPERAFLDKDTQQMFEAVAAKVPGYELTVGSHDKAEQKFIFAAWNDRTRGTRWLYDVKTHSLTNLGEVTPWLKEADMAEMKPIEYKSRDGLTIHGYLTLPKGADAKHLPIVVNPHGGPWYRDSWHFNPEVQFLASRGYGVFQMNFRGSTGYGKKFWEASFKQWGKAMQNDITDGVQYLIGQGIADPKRVAIYGGSYGGYATLAGVTFTPDLYACAVDYVGVSNLFTFMKTIPPYWKPMLDQVHEMVGDPEKDKELMVAASPVMHAERIKAPLLIAQGAKDPRVNIDESNQMVQALKKRGVTVQYLVKDNEGHGFHNEENRFEFYEAMEKFLAQHLGPRGTKTAQR